MKIVAAEWFCAGHGNVGVVMVVDEYEGVKYYIGACKGIDEEDDKQWIADWGSRLPNHVGNALFGVE